MTYASGEELIANIIRDLPEFDASNVARSDWTILNNGKSDHYAIVRRGAMGARGREWISPTVYVARWVTYVEVWQKVLPDNGLTRSELFRHVESVMTLLELPTLADPDGVIQDSSIPGMTEPEEMWTAGGGPVFLRITVEVVWDEQREIAYQ